MAMDTEEMIRAQPMDAVVLMGGCDKTVPAQLMGAVSAGRPAVSLIGGPLMNGPHNGEQRGACPQRARALVGRGTESARPPQRRTAGRLHRLPPLLGAVPRRQDF